MTYSRRDVWIALLFGAGFAWFVTYSFMGGEIQRSRAQLGEARRDMCYEVEDRMTVKRGYVYPTMLQYFCGYTDASGRYHLPGEYTDVEGKQRADPNFPQ